MIKLFHFWCAWLLIAKSVSTNVSSVPSNAANIEEIRRMLRIADDLTILARLVNGISLGQGLADGTVKVDTVVEELLDLPPNVTLDSLVSGGVGELDTDLGAIAKAVSEECGGKGGCGDSGLMARGLAVLEEADKIALEVEKVVADGSSLSQILAVYHYVRQIEKGERISSKVTNFFWGSKRMSLLKEFADNCHSFMNGYNNIDYLTLTLKQQNLLQEADVMRQLVDISNTSLSKQMDVNQMRDRFITTQKVLSVLRPLVSKDAVKGVNEKLDALGRLIDSRSQGVPEKKLTGAYLGGMDELKEHSGDVETEFVTETIGNGKGVEGLRQLLTPVDRLFEGLHPLRNSWKQLRLDGKREAVEDVKRRLEAAAREVNSQYVDTILSVPSYSECFGVANLYPVFRRRPWEVFQENMKHFDARVAEYRGKLRFVRTDPRDFHCVHPVSMKDLEDGQKYKEVDDAAMNYGELFSSLNPLVFFQFITDSSIPEAREAAEDWMLNTKLGVTRKCLLNNPNLTHAHFSNASFASVPNLQLSTDSVRSVLGASAVMKSVLGEWKTFESGSNQSRTRRSAVLAGGGKLSEELAAGVKVLRNVADVYRKRRAIERVLGAQDSIDAAVNGLQDAKQKSEAESVWTAETKRGLRSLVEGTVHKWAQSMGEVPEKISDYESVFRKAHALDYPSIDTRKLKRALGFLTKPPGIQEALGAIGELDLQFVNAKSRLDTASATLPTLMAFFDGLLGISRVVTTTPAPTTSSTEPPETTTASPEPTTTESATSPDTLPTAAPLEQSPSDPDSSDLSTIIIAVLAVMLVVAIGLNLVQVYMCIQKKKEDEKRKEKEKNDKKKQKAKKEDAKERVESNEKEVGNDGDGKPSGSNSIDRSSEPMSLPVSSPAADGEVMRI